MKIESNFSHIRKIRHRSDRSLYVYKDKILFSCNDQYTWPLTEMFIHELYFMNDNKKYVVIDMGANIGLASLYFANYQNIQKIYSYEPVKNTYQNLVENINYNPLLKEKIITYNYALGENDGEVTIYTHPKLILTSSLFLDHDVRLSEGSSEIIKIKRASEEMLKVLANHPNSPILVKIDVEGSEYMILENLHKNGLLEKIDKMFIEFHKGINSIPYYFKELFDYNFIEHQGDENELILVEANRKKS